MAEAVLQKFGGRKFRAYSAGSDPAEQPLPEVIERLKMLGHDISKLRCKYMKKVLATRARNNVELLAALNRTSTGAAHAP